MKFFLFLIFLLFPLISNAQQKFLPENNLDLEDYGFSGNGMTEEIFNSAIEESQRIFAPIVKKLGARLEIAGDWNNSTVNAYASQSGGVWHVQMFGGLARRSEVTPDGFLLVIGHEIGHHVGGFPFYPKSWAAAEGQSDISATHVFAKKMWENTIKTKLTRDALYPGIVVQMCDDAYDKIGYQNRCYRSLMASMSLAQLLRSLSREEDVRFDTPDQTCVRKTNTSYPRTVQSRLDSMIAGALCPVKWEYDNIPKGERPSTYVFCWEQNYSEYSRPKSWFRPKIVDP